MKSLETRRIEIHGQLPGESPTERPEASGTPRVPFGSDGEESRRPALRTHPLERSEGRLPDGYLLQDRYRVLGVIGVGGMSIVYKAQDMRFPRVTRLCVVKEMRNSATDPQTRAVAQRNFEREANILATLSHPTIVQAFDYFSEADISYLVQEYVEGSDLETLLADLEGFLPEPQVVHWAIQICEVLSFLHSHEPQPIIFRDLKPSNIMIDVHGRIRLVDFGIARVFQSGLKGTMVGTEGYSPPEQYRGSVDPRVDIYALGATIHHLLSKQDPRLEPPFSFHERPIHQTNPFVSRELVEVINRALEYDVNKRYSSAEEMHRALGSLNSARGIAGATSTGAPAFLSSNVMALWRFACEDEVRSTPAVHDGVVYVGAYDSNAYAIDAESGKFRWKYATEGSVGSSPCVFGDRVFFGSSDHSLYAVNAETARIAWTCPTSGSIWSSPRAAFGHVFFGSDDRHFYAVSAQNGRVAWKFQAEGVVRSSPAIGDDAIYVACEAGVVYALDMSGQGRWRFRARRGVTASPALTEDMVYVGCQDRNIYSLDIRSGWSVWRYRTGGPVVSSAAVDADEGIVYVGSSDGFVYALDLENGHLVWRFGTDGQVSSSPAVADGAVYFGSVDGSVYSVDAKTGNLRWRFQTDGKVTSSPTVANGVVYIGSHDRGVYALAA